MKTTLQLLAQNITRAQDDLVSAMEHTWPVGTEISFRLHSGAKNCTIGTVLGHHSDGRVRVELTTKGRRGYFTIKRIHWSQIS